MTTILQPRTITTPSAAPAQAVGVAGTSANRRPLALDGVLGRLERAAARLPHALALPVMVAHAAISTVAYR